jgi:hypothetical protein
MSRNAWLGVGAACLLVFGMCGVFIGVVVAAFKKVGSEVVAAASERAAERSGKTLSNVRGNRKSAEDWSDVTAQADISETLQVRIDKAMSSYLPGKEVGRQVNVTELLYVSLVIVNRHATKSVDYAGWGTIKHPNESRLAKVVTDAGENLRHPKLSMFFETEFGPTEGCRIRPGQQITDKLVLGLPMDEAATEVRLTLPLSTVGGTGTVRLKKAIDWQKMPAKKN